MSYVDARDWIQSYESIKTQIKNRRKIGLNFSTAEKKSMNNVLNTMEFQLKTFSSNPTDYDICLSEVARREVLLQNLKRQLLNTSASTYMQPTSNAISQRADKKDVAISSITVNPIGVSEQQLALRQKEVIKLQDDMLLDIEQGVGRLFGQAKQMKEDTAEHTIILNTLDGQVDTAADLLKREAQHAVTVRKQSQSCWVYVIIGGEVLLLLALLSAVFLK